MPKATKTARKPKSIKTAESAPKFTRAEAKFVRECRKDGVPDDVIRASLDSIDRYMARWTARLIIAIEGQEPRILGTQAKQTRRKA